MALLYSGKDSNDGLVTVDMKKARGGEAPGSGKEEGAKELSVTVSTSIT